MVSNGKTVFLTWDTTRFAQLRQFAIWRAVGSFSPAQLASNTNNVLASFKNIQTFSSTNNQPPTSLNDSNIKNGTTYTYFVTDNNVLNVQSPPSNLLVVTVKF